MRVERQAAPGKADLVANELTVGEVAIRNWRLFTLGFSRM